MELTGQRGADVAFEVIGLGQTIDQTITMTRRGGQAILVGVPKMDVMVNVPAFFGVVLMEKTIKGCWYGSSQRAHATCRSSPSLYKEGELKLDELISAHDHARRGQRGLRRHGDGRGRPLGDRSYLTPVVACGHATRTTREERARRSRRSGSAPGRIATDWWGRVDDKQGLVARRARRRHHLLRHRAGLRRRRLRRDDPRRHPRPTATTSSSRRSAATTSTRPASRPASPSARRTGEPASVRSPARRRRCAASAASTSTCYQLHNVRIEPVLRRRRCGPSSTRSQREGKVRRARRRPRTRDRLGRRGPRVAAASARSSSLQTVFNLLEQEPGRTFAARGRGGRRAHRPHRPRPARLRRPVGQGHPRHRVRGRRPPRAPQAREHARPVRQGRHARVPGRPRPAARSARPRSPASSRSDGFTTVLPTCVTVDEVREYAAAADLPALRRRAHPGRRAVGRELRRHRPLRDAAEEQH